MATVSLVTATQGHTLRGFVVNPIVLGLDFCWSAVVELGMDPRVIELIDPARVGEFEIVGACWRGSGRTCSPSFVVVT